MHEFRTGLLSQMRALVECDVASYNEIDRHSQEAFVVADPQAATELSEVKGELERFGELVLENPMAAYSLRTGDPRALRMSDFIGERALHGLELYHCLYRHLDVEHQIAFAVPSQGQLIGIALSRGVRDFDAHELALLDAARAMVLPVHRNLHARASAEAVLAAVELEDEGPHAILLVHPSGALEPAHARAERLLRGLDCKESPLQALHAWARAQRRSRVGGSQPLELIAGGARLSARYVFGAAGGLDAVSIRALAEPTPELLRALGLTRRQAQVLELVWKGASNAAIARALQISEHTVRHHLEHIYTQLGVDTRAAAAHRASMAALERSTLW